MKLTLFLTGAAAVFLFLLWACQKHYDPVPQFPKAGASSIALSADKSSVVLAAADADKTALAFTWSDPKFPTKLAAVKFTLLVAKSGSNFSNPTRFEFTGELTGALTAVQLNGLALKYAPLGDSAVLDMKMIASLSNNNQPVASNTIQITITPYSDFELLPKTATLECTSSNANEKAVKFSWPKGAFDGFDGAITYQLQYARAGTNFAWPVKSDVADTTKSYTFSEINEIALNHGITASIAGEMEFRVMATNELGAIQITNVSVLSITPYAAFILTPASAALTCLPTNANEQAVAFEWEGAFRGYRGAVAYQFQYAKAGTNFATPVRLDIDAGSKSFTFSEMNVIALSHDIAASTRGDVEFRAVATNEQGTVQTTNVAVLSITPYAAFILTPISAALTCLPTNGNETAVTFNWAGAFSGYAGTVTYRLQYARAGTNFASPTSETVTASSKAYTFSQINAIALSVARDVEFRAVATNGEGTEQTTNISALSVIPLTYASIGLLGDATAGGWDNDLDLHRPDATGRPAEWEGTFYLLGGKSCKFRAEDNWGMNWGGADFPSGVGVSNGPNIPVAASGYYRVTLNTGTGAYTFTTAITMTLTPASETLVCSVANGSETAVTFNWVGAFSGYSGTVTYQLQYARGGTNFASPTSETVTASSKAYTFSQINTIALNKGLTASTSGNMEFRAVATNGEGAVQTSNISVLSITPFIAPPAYASIGIIGDATTAGNWDNDLDLRRSDATGRPAEWEGTFYLLGGKACKFRANDGWDDNWGGTAFPSGTGASGGGNIPVSASGYYRVTFNTETKAYAFTTAVTLTPTSEALVCSAANGSETAVTLNWAGAFSDFTGTLTYQLQYARGGTNFASPTSAAVTASSKAYTFSELNTIALNNGLTASTNGNMEFRVVATSGTEVVRMTNTSVLSITPYVAFALTPASETLVCSAANGSETAVTFNWTGAFSGYSGTVTYQLQYAKGGTNFASPTSETVTASSKAYTFSQINTIALNKGLTASTSGNMEFRAVATNGEGTVQTSNVSVLSITPYVAFALTPASEALVCSAANGSETAVTFNWAGAFSGYSGTVTYQLQYARGGTNFASPTSETVTASSKAYTFSQINTIALNKGLTASTSGNMEFRAVATNGEGAVQTSNISVLSITPFIAPPAYASIGIIGDATTAGNWDNDLDLRRSDATGRLAEWEGTFYLLGGKACKFRANDGWDDNWGGTAFPSGTGASGGGNIPVSASGYYRVTFNTETKAYAFTAAVTLTPASEALVCSAANGSETAVTLNWAGAFSDFTGTLTYQLQYARGGTNFASPTSAAVTASSKAYTFSELNTIALNNGLTASTNGNMEFRVVATSGTEIVRMTNTSVLSITPYVAFALTPESATLVCSVANGSETAVTFNWAGAFSGYSGTVTYQLQYAKGGTNFASPTIETVTASSKAYTFSQINTIALNKGLTASTSGNMEFRAVATNGEGTVQTSNISVLSITPFRTSSSVRASIGLAGDATAGGWDNDSDLYRPDATGNPTNWEGVFYLLGGKSCKFRADDKWDISWGSAAFPSGTGASNGSNIPVNVSGYYRVRFNAGTGAYTFEKITVPTVTSVALTGAQFEWGNGFQLTRSAADAHIFTGTTRLDASAVKFRADNAWTISWGGSTFPSGHGGGNDITVTVAGTYFIYINIATGEYFFAPTDRSAPYSRVGIGGTATANGWDASDIKLIQNPSMPFRYSATVALTGGEAKFRANNVWGVNWASSAFPAGVGTGGGANIPVTEGTYVIRFHSATGEYSFGHN